MAQVIVSYLLTLLLVGCSSMRQSKSPVVSAPKKSQVAKKRPMAKKKKTTREVGRGEAVWHLLSPLGVELSLESDAGTRELIKVETTLSQLVLPAGRWQITGFVLDGTVYELLEGTNPFEFEMKKNGKVYVGSYLIECPKVATSNLSALKAMKFFNRYPFSSDQGACELIVGNDIERVRKAWSKLENAPASKLQLGF